MCGIAGILAGRRVERSLLQAMARSIVHRGPDDQGIWLDEQERIGFAHRRLSIVDLSPLGHQPMASHDGRYMLCYNGEIYNHGALRAELDALGQHDWRGHSDTETLLEAIAAWGLTAALQKAVGQFAIALWDRRERKLHLARDRFGEKPLYYGWVGADFVFASELKAIRQHPGFDNAVNRTALQLFASRTYIPAPLSIFERLFKLEPGCILSVDSAALANPRVEPPRVGESDGGLAMARYWSYRDVVERGLGDPIADEEEALERLDAALGAAIAGQSMADVPVGAFLSGGFDSSTVVAFYQRHSSTPIRTFSIGFEEQGYDEAPYARAVARHFGTQHNERYVTVREAQALLPALPSMYDEPFADSSQIPTHLVSKFAREQVTVALSGDGGDELFGGYNRYFGAARLWGHLRRLPAPARRIVGRSFAEFSPATWNRLVNLLPSHRQPPHFGYKVQKAFRTMGNAANLDDVFNAFLDEWHQQPSPVLGVDGSARPWPFDLQVAGGSDAARMMYCDAVSYLPDDILCKVDRASMAVSLESRVPFLDHRVAEVAARIPERMKIRGNKGKMILRKLLYRHAPAELFERPKAGFGFPVGQWIKGELRPWAEELLDENRLRAEGYFDAAMVRRRWEDHLAGVRDSSFSIWAILMFQAWLQHWQSAAEPAQLRAAG